MMVRRACLSRAKACSPLSCPASAQVEDVLVGAMNFYFVLQFGMAEPVIMASLAVNLVLLGFKANCAKKIFDLAKERKVAEREMAVLAAVAANMSDEPAASGGNQASRLDEA